MEGFTLRDGSILSGSMRTQDFRRLGWPACHLRILKRWYSCTSLVGTRCLVGRFGSRFMVFGCVGMLRGLLSYPIRRVSV